MGFLYSIPMRPGRLDSILWNLSSHASFEVSSFYPALSQPATSHFPWRLVWKAKFHLEWLFSFGQLHWAKSSPQTIWEDIELLSWIGVVYVRQMANLSITCFSIALLPAIFGTWFVVSLGSLGLCLGEWWTFFSVGMAVWVVVRLAKFGKWYLIALCGVFGVSIILEFLMGRKHPFQLWSFGFYRLCLSG